MIVFDDVLDCPQCFVQNLSEVLQTRLEIRWRRKREGNKMHNYTHNKKERQVVICVRVFLKLQFVEF